MIVDLRMLALISPNFGYKMGVLFNKSSTCNYGLVLCHRNCPRYYGLADEALVLLDSRIPKNDNKCY